MPDVGVLQLTIQDNSSAAAGGLDQLAGALLRVKVAAAGGLNLSEGSMSVAAQVKKLASEVKGSSSIIAHLGTLFNSISNFAKLKDITINTQPIEALKTALEGGIGIGRAGTEINKLREALTGDWGNEESLGLITTSMNNIASAASNMASADAAGTIKSVAKSIEAYVSAIGSVSGGGAHDYLQQQVFSATASGANSTGSNLAGGIKEGIDSQKEEVITSSVQMVQDAISAMKSALGIHSPSAVAESEVGTPTGQGIVVGLEKTSSEVQEAARHVAEEMISAMRSTIDSSTNIGAITGQQEALEKTISTVQATTDAQIKLNSAGEAYAGTIRIFDEASGAYKQMYVDAGNVEKTVSGVKAQTDDLTASMKNAIDLTQVPSSGAYGVFKNAAEEITYFKGKIEEAELSMKQFNDIVMSSEKQLKYGGPTNKAELLFNVEHGTEGYFKAEEAAELYKLQLIKVQEHAAAVAESMQMATQANTAQAESMRKVADSTSQANDAMEKAVVTVQHYTNGMAVATPQQMQLPQWTSGDVSNIVNYYSQIELLEMKMHGMEDALARDINANKLDQSAIAERAIAIQNLKDKIDELKQKQEETTESTFSLSGSYKGFKKSLEAMFPTLTSLYKSFVRMAKMRAIRYVIRQIAAGFKEGTQNVYEYSKAIGSTFHTSMDDAASSLAQMKNALGAQLAPVLQMLIPIMQNVVNWFINVLNVVNQFFSLLNGRATWTRALPQATQAFKDQTKAAKGASSAMKDLLADWDELNIIQSQNSGGGGSSSAKEAVDYASMFEEVSEYDEGIKHTVDYIKDHFDDIVKLAKMAGVLILAWKVSKAFGGVLSTLGTIAAGVALVITGITFGSMAGESAGTKGFWDTKDTLTAFGSALAAGLGGALIGFQIGGVYGAAAGFIIGVSASVIATFASFNAANDLRKMKLQWGGKDYSPEAIKEYIKSQFSFDIEAQINKMTLTYDKHKNSKEALERSINNFTSSLNLAKIKVQLGADDTHEALKALYESAMDVIEKFKESQDYKLEAIQVAMELTPLRGPDGQELTQDFIDTLMVGEQKLTEYMTDLGAKIAKAYNDGVNAHWGEGTIEAYLAQIEQLNAIQQEHDTYLRNRKSEEQKEIALENMSYDSAETAMQEIDNWKETYKQGVIDLQTSIYENESESAAYWSGILKWMRDNGQGDTDLYKEREGYFKNAQEAADAANRALQDIDTYMEGLEDYQATMEEFRRRWAAILKENGVIDFVGKNNIESETQNLSKESVIEAVKEYSKTGDVKQAAATMLELLNRDFDINVSEQLPFDIAQKYNLKHIEVMNDENQQKLLEYLVKWFDHDVTKEIINLMDISDEEKANLLKRLYDIQPQRNIYNEEAEVIYGTGETNGTIDRTQWNNLNNGINLGDFLTAEGLFKLLPYTNPITWLGAPSADFDYYEEEQKRIDEQAKAAQLTSEYYNQIMDLIDASGSDNAWEYITKINNMFLEQDYEGLKNILDYINKYGIDSELDNYGQFGAGTGKYGIVNGRYIASAGVSDVGWGNKAYYPTGENQLMTDNDISGNVETGVKAGNIEQNALLEQAIRLLGQIAGKDFNVTITPTSSAGAWVRNSSQIYEKVHG